MAVELDSHIPSAASADTQSRAQEESEPRQVATMLAGILLSVTLENLKAHLALLQSFSNLKRTMVDTYDGTGRMSEELGASSRWEAFVGSAVARFDVWVKGLGECAATSRLEEVRGGTLDFLPPTDVLMVWHAYMLNPRAYREDVSSSTPAPTERQRGLQVLASLGEMLALHFNDLPSVIDSRSHNRVKFWKETTGGCEWDSGMSPLSSVPELDSAEYSVELVGAVLRQESFIGKMVHLGWTHEGAFDYDERVELLKRALSRYRGFLALLSHSSPRDMRVPTLDIDLVWHTHQLFAKTYEHEVGRIVGRFVNHDDKIDKGRLGGGFKETSRSWKELFGVDYGTSHTSCDCKGQQLEVSTKAMLSTTNAQLLGALPLQLHLSYDQATILEQGDCAGCAPGACSGSGDDAACGGGCGGGGGCGEGCAGGDCADVDQL